MEGGAGENQGEQAEILGTYLEALGGAVSMKIGLIDVDGHSRFPNGDKERKDET